MSTNTLAYLATPYSRYPAGIEVAFMDAAFLASRLLRAGILVYSPIAHTHPLATYGDLDPLDHSIWLPFDELMMARCDTLIVAHMEGWQESKGIAHEIEFFKRAGKPIFDLPDITTCTLARRPDARTVGQIASKERLRRAIAEQMGERADHQRERWPDGRLPEFP